MVYPKVLTTDENLQVDICPYGSETKVIETEFILDFNQYREIIGIEILNLKLEAGRTCLNKIKENIKTVENIRYSYDEETDSFYLKLVSDRSIDQEAVIGKLTLNTEGEIVSLGAKLVEKLKPPQKC